MSRPLLKHTTTTGFATLLSRITGLLRVVVRSGYLGADQLAAAHLGYTEDVATAVRDALGAAGPDARLCVLPEGPQTIPYVAA